MDMDKAKQIVTAEAIRQLQMARMGMERNPVLPDVNDHLEEAMALLTVLGAVK